MKAAHLYASGVAFILVFFQIFNFDLKGFTDYGYDDVLTEKEDQLENRELKGSSRSISEQTQLVNVKKEGAKNKTEVDQQTSQESAALRRREKVNEQTSQKQQPVDVKEGVKNKEEVKKQTSEQKQQVAVKKEVSKKEEVTEQTSEQKQPVDVKEEGAKNEEEVNQLTTPESSALQKSNSEKFDAGPLTCKSETECCASWDVNSDDWWTQHPDWDIGEETEDQYCFQRTEDEERREFVLKLHHRQWKGAVCGSMLKSVEQNSGFGSSTDWLVQSMWHATQERDRTFQIAHNLRPWLYAVDDPDHWAFCEERDSRCFYLPISACENRTETIHDEHYTAPGYKRTQLPYYWMRLYLFRPNQVFRRKQWEMRSQLPLQAPCTAVHVRRSDAGFPRPPFRRYAAVQEYLDAVSNLKKGDNILLLTDDQTTIDEVNKYLINDYKWVWLDRQRNRGLEGGWDGHIPSGDQAFEMLAIDTELRLAKMCNQLVYGHSGFMINLAHEMGMENKTYTQYKIETTVSAQETKEKFGGKPQLRVKTFFEDIDQVYVDRGIPAKVLTTWKDDIRTPSDVEVKGTEKLVTCSSNPEQCCGTWDVNADNWWLHKPDWEVSMENETHFCFTPIKNETQREFLINLHEFQWGGTCKDVEKTVVVNSGFGSSIAWNTVSFFHAWKQQKQFQLIHHGRHWLYATHDKSSWAYCESADSRCYYLPIGRCSREETIRGEHHDERPKRGEKYIWHLLKKYSNRPNQEFRRKTFEMKQRINLQYPCTTIHVRRGDAGVPAPPYRRYAAVQEYLDAGNVEEGSNVLLLTDDDSTLAEIKKHLADKYNWIYFEKPRNQGVDAGFDRHIPSGDEALEMVTIASEQQLAASCQKIVHGHSGFVKSLLEDMAFDKNNITTYSLDTEVTKEEALKYKADQQGRVKKFMQDIEEYYQRRAQEIGSQPSKQALSETHKASTNNARPEVKEVSNAIVSPQNLAPSVDEKMDDSASGLVCDTTAQGKQCCGGWDKNVDTWWTHHPTWEVSSLTETSQCFQPIANVEKANYLQRLYNNQWKGNCNDLITSTQINSGFSADVNWLGYIFLTAINEGKPFQITRHDDPWIFGPQSKESWAYCESEDITCFLLDLSNCKRDYVSKVDLQEHVKNRVTSEPSGPNGKVKFSWLRQFMLRPNQAMRQQLMRIMQPMEVTAPCTVMHIRRGDSGLPGRPYRRYAAVQEYLDEGNVQEGETVLLLTDDQSTIDEINTYHQNYNWVYLNRTRHNGVEGGRESHVPSGDGPFEVLAIEAEARLATPCSKAVQGRSGFMKYILGHLEAEGQRFEHFIVKNGVSKEDALKWPGDGKERTAHFMKEMEEYRKKSSEQKARARQGGEDKDAVSLAGADGGGSPMSCTGDGVTQECCASWDVNVDEWWTHKPTWEVSKETVATQCFSPMKDAERLAYFQHVYDIQWKGDCSRLVSSTQVNSGYGAATNWLGYTFYNATTDGNPFQIAEHESQWLYGPKDKSSWAYCDSEDITCFILPLSQCQRKMIPQPQRRKYPRSDKRPDKAIEKEKMEFEWLKEFMLRPKQVMRLELMKMRNSVKLTSPCTTMHVRRGDSGLPRRPYRRYAAVQEYLDAAEVEEGDTIMLLTDDQSTIDEINEYHQNYNWVYVNRTRINGVDGGWESHVPSGDGPFEVLVIDTETYLAGLCEKVVHGMSGFMAVVRGIMEAQGKQYKAYVIDTGVTEAEAKKWSGNEKERWEYFKKQMEEYRKTSAQNKKKKQAEIQK